MGNIGPLYALYGPDGERISYGEDERKLWIDEIRKQFQGIKIDSTETSDYVGEITSLMKRGYSMHPLTVGARMEI